MSVANLVLALGITATVVLIVLAVSVSNRLRRKATRMGYPSVGSYLRAAPRSDEEKRDAVDLALKGLVICLLGLVFPPLLLIGPFPLFYGARKVVWASMGLGLVDDAD
ncbi:MAG: hypothetical protein ABFS34_06375 [Gemmatimonadota bacterium]